MSKPPRSASGSAGGSSRRGAVSSIRGAAATARARLRKPSAHHDRDQRHFLRRPEAGKLSPLARRDAGGFRLLVQGSSLCDTSLRSCRGRPDRRSFRFERVARIARQARADPVAISAEYAVEEGAFAAFLELLPHSIDGRALRHTIELRRGKRRDRFVRRPASPAHEWRSSPATINPDFEVTADFAYTHLRGCTRGVDRLSAGCARRLDTAFARTIGAGRSAIALSTSSAVPRSALPPPRRRSFTG